MALALRSIRRQVDLVVSEASSISNKGGALARANLNIVEQSDRSWLPGPTSTRHMDCCEMSQYGRQRHVDRLVYRL